MRALPRLLISFVFATELALLSTAGTLMAQFPGQNRGGAGASDPSTKLNLGALGDINNSTPKVVPQRVLQGVVHDQNGAPVKGAIVYLKGDSKTTGTKSMSSDDKGSFRFVQLSRSAEYTVWAQVQDKKSPVKSVSSFETKDDLVRNLQIP